jgi:hypothetical protein
MCCSGAKKSVRSSTVVPKPTLRPQKSPTVLKVHRQHQTAEVAPIMRQYVVTRVSCPRCQKPTMVVLVAGRERQQCTNNECRLILT